QVDHGSQRPEGLGLGLSIVRRLAALLECRIAVESKLGHGTVFSVTAPRAEMRDTAPASTGAADARAGGRILVVDDEPAVAEATSMLLELEGFVVDVASSTGEAVEAARANAPDVIVSDFYLRGGQTGVGAVSAVRDLLDKRVPVVFVTGDTGKSALEAAIDDRTRVLSKPIRADELLTAVWKAAHGASGDA